MKKQLLLLLAIALLTQNIAIAQDYTLLFDGIASRVRYPSDATLDNMNGINDYTIEAWIKPTSDDNNLKCVLKRYYQFAIFTTNDVDNSRPNRLYFVAYNNSGSGFIYVNSSYNSLKVNEWNHVAIISNAAEDYTRIYVNGVDETSEYSTGDPATFPATTLEPAPDEENETYHPNLFVGYNGTAQIPTAYIDKIRIKNAAVDPASLQTSITDPAYSVDADTVMLLNFNEGTGAVTVNEVTGTNADLECYNGCAEIPTWELVANTVSVNENNTTDFTLFPNPVNDNTFTVQAGTNESIEKIEVYNILGQVVKTIVLDTQLNKINVNVGNLSHGQYLVKTKTNIGTGVRKLVIN